MAWLTGQSARPAPLAVEAGAAGRCLADRTRHRPAAWLTSTKKPLSMNLWLDTTITAGGTSPRSFEIGYRIVNPHADIALDLFVVDARLQDHRHVRQASEDLR